eukprot:3021211-Rhodomonas_salina.1
MSRACSTRIRGGGPFLSRWVRNWLGVCGGVLCAVCSVCSVCNWRSVCCCVLRAMCKYCSAYADVSRYWSSEHLVRSIANVRYFTSTSYDVSGTHLRAVRHSLLHTVHTGGRHGVAHDRGSLRAVGGARVVSDRVHEPARRSV